jgi:hypothetical protein
MDSKILPPTMHVWVEFQKAEIIGVMSFVRKEMQPVDVCVGFEKQI